MSVSADVLAPLERPAAGSRRTRLLTDVLLRPGGALGAAGTLLVLLSGLSGPWLAPHDPFSADGPSLSAPSGAYPMGTDALGRDVLSGVLHGARTSLVVGATVGAIVLVLGLAIGMLAGYRRGWVDDALMRLTEAFQVLPRFFLALVVLAFFGPGLDRLIFVLGGTSWPLLARVVRADVLALRDREFVDAARSAGASGLRIVLREILPHTASAATAVLVLVVAQVILLEAGLAFIGLGDPNALSWGTLASEAQRYLRVAWWLSVFPGVAILVTVLSLNLLGDALDDAVRGTR